MERRQGQEEEEEEERRQHTHLVSRPQQADLLSQSHQVASSLTHSNRTKCLSTNMRHIKLPGKLGRCEQDLNWLTASETL